LHRIQALCDNAAWTVCPLRPSGIGFARRLTRLTELAAAWVAGPSAVGLAGWRNSMASGRIGRTTGAIGSVAARRSDACFGSWLCKNARSKPSGIGSVCRFELEPPFSDFASWGYVDLFCGLEGSLRRCWRPTGPEQGVVLRPASRPSEGRCREC